MVTAIAQAETSDAAMRTRATSAALRERLRDYISLTKPRVMTLLLYTGACAYLAAGRGHVSLRLFTEFLLGLALACGGASALNHALDADIDRLMGPRTRERPVAAARVPRAHAVTFGIVLTVVSFALLTSTVNLLTAGLALAGGLFYVVVYTGWLKRSTAQNIVIGGAAGAVPPLVGWAAATGKLALPALLLFAVVFFWTPPHFWALALLLKRDYQAAGVPMLPVVRGDRETSKQILRYTLMLLAITVVSYATGSFGTTYFVAALVLGGGLLALAERLRRQTTPRNAALLFRYSLLYLALLFGAAAIDRLLA
jgi:protoheme IX farnesyltransferase